MVSKAVMMDRLNSEYGIFMSNGQRIIRPLDPRFEFEKEYEETKLHEVFIYNLPYNLYEDELLPFVCRVGRIYQIRLMLNFSGKTKGRAFVVFEQVRDAYRAVEELNGQLIRRNHQPVKVTFSVNNRRLHLHGIPSCKTVEQLEKELNLIGMISIKLFPSKTSNPFLNEAIIKFKDHQLAASSRRLFVAGSIILDGFKVSANWAKPKDFQTLLVMFNCSIACLLDKRWMDKVITNLFENDFAKIQNVSLKQNLCFIKYQSFSMANAVYKFYSDIQYPITLNSDIQITKVCWPERK